MESVWQNNRKLRKWEKKNLKYNANGNFNYNLAFPLQDPLVIKISDCLNIDKEYIYVGAGISQFINALVGLKIFDTVFLPSIEFNLYKRVAQINQKKICYIDGKYVNDLILHLKNMKSTKNDLLCFSSPRWFSGEMFSIKQIKEILEIFKGTVIVDEAYVDYSDNENGVLDLVLKDDRLILLRSFSKKFLASGFRTGYMITKKSIEGMRSTIIPPHSVTSYSENFFVKLLSDRKILHLFSETRNYIKQNRNIIYDELSKYENIEVIQSKANFITIVFYDDKLFNDVYNNLSDLPGIQKFDVEEKFIKIWVNNEFFSKVVIDRMKSILY